MSNIGVPRAWYPWKVLLLTSSDGLITHKCFYFSELCRASRKFRSAVSEIEAGIDSEILIIDRLGGNIPLRRRRVCADGRSHSGAGCVGTLWHRHTHPGSVVSRRRGLDDVMRGV